VPEDEIFMSLRVIQSPVSGSAQIDGKKIIVLGSNNYRGLANHPIVLAAFHEGLRQYGAGTGMNPPLATTNAHRRLEEALAEFHQAEAALVFNSCTAANLALLDTVTTAGDLIFSDELNHASIIDGCRLSRARVVRVKHRSVASFSQALEQSPSGEPQQRKLFITDGVFSMEGYTAPLPEFLEATTRSNTMFALDESHAAGVVGNTGRGSAELHDCMDKIDYVTGTLSKAFGAVGGGYICASNERIAELKGKARLALFSSSIGPAAAEAAAAAVSLARSDLESLERMRYVAEKFRSGVAQLGFKTVNSESPITPVLIGDAEMTQVFSQLLEQGGVYVPALAFPVVPEGTARLRAQTSAAHADDDIDFALSVFERVGRDLRLI
jgi:glycine C-acetyltransferase